jgi:predicted nucleotide-binding protein
MIPAVTDTTQKPGVFIGSSSESSDLASALKSHLEARGEVLVTHWADAFGLGQFTLDALEALVHDFDFAAFIVAADDVVISRDQHYAGVRDNVLLEAGMFISAIGRERCYLLYPDDFRVKIPSDINGMSLPTWSVRERTNPPAALRSIAHELLRDMRLKGVRVNPSPQLFLKRDDVKPRPVAGR